jgi:hypothetical protein
MNEQAATFAGWDSVVGFEGLYEVSDQGQVRRAGRVLRDQHVPGGYRKVQLWKDGRPHNRLVHCLVAEAFLGPVPVGQEVNHRDGDKTHNAVSNLEYLTRSDNNRHAYRTGLRVATVEQMVRARRKPRITTICACGCGAQLQTPDRKGRDRRYINGHNQRRAS